MTSSPAPGSAGYLAAAQQLQSAQGVCVFITDEAQAAERLRDALRFFLNDPQLPVLSLPDWETLPYDVFSPHEDIISQRLQTLYALPELKRGALVLPISTALLRLPPRSWLASECLNLSVGERLDRDTLLAQFTAAGYQSVSQVQAHGEFAVRGALLDVWPMGSEQPLRIDLLDDEIETIRLFDPQTQRSLSNIPAIRLLPAHEFPLNEASIKRFRANYRDQLAGDPNVSVIYREVSQGHAPAGIEYYLPLFFEQVETLFEHLPENLEIYEIGDVGSAAKQFYEQLEARYEQRRYDPERPLLPPQALYLSPGDYQSRVQAQRGRLAGKKSKPLPELQLRVREAQPAAGLKDFLNTLKGRCLLLAETAGRREVLLDTLREQELRPQVFEHWAEFIASDAELGLCIGPLESGFHLPEKELAVITEAELFGQKARQERRQKKPTRDADAIVRNLTDLHPGAPVVHEEHGVGRYLGLNTLSTGGQVTEYLMLEYAGSDKLYVPVSALHLISRYTGSDPEHAPLHKLGSEQWSKARRKAAEKAHDVAAELLEIHARRAARQGHAHALSERDYQAFAEAFPFEETPDQGEAIRAVIADMQSSQPMDRVVCGDVGFGKTEVAMRAAFVAVQGGSQVAVLVPTTLLAQQHEQNFRDRFADWPVRIESLSRFGSAKEQKVVMQGLAEGKVDIVIGTHKLIQGMLEFKNLGLVIIDEEQRFGVRHKEKLKALRAEVDLLTLTATPIPRTLNMALAGLRDLSIIATPPGERLAIKTFVSQDSDALIQEACWREMRRGGQVYFLHNEVQSIERRARQLAELMPEARIGIAHGQMREKDLERVMLDFYHRRFNILVCTTIIESGIDVPTANTIIMDRADKLGLSQLHQLRGRVGRSHHRAYAYLLTPHPSAMTKDAVKRLEAIESLGELGVGFTLASHDLEIRGAGELLGEEQSGQIQEVGFSLYNDLLERAVKALQSGQLPDLSRMGSDITEVELGLPALLPEDYVPDVHVRLILYKRISACVDEDALRELEVELIDRFGLLPPPAKHLMAAARLRQQLEPLGVRKLEMGAAGGRMIFQDQPPVDAQSVIQLLQSAPTRYALDGPTKLRFNQPMPGLDERVQAVADMLSILRPEPQRKAA